MPKPASWFAEMTEGYEGDPEFLLQDAKLAFAEQLEELLERRHMSRADLARRLGTSRAYVTRVLRAEFNLTLETMIRIGLALDARVSLGMVAKDAPHRARRAPIRIPTARRVESPHEFVVCDKPARRSSASK